MEVQPYLFFNGRCEEAIEFYRRALGARVTMLARFKEAPNPEMCAPGREEKIMHASFQIGRTTLLASDGRGDEKLSFEGFSLSLSPATDADAARIFAALAEGGQVRMPLEKTFYASSFGMVTDRFGVLWMVMVEPQRSASPA